MKRSAIALIMIPVLMLTVGSALALSLPTPTPAPRIGIEIMGPNDPGNNDITDASGQSMYVLVLTGDEALTNSFDEAYELRFTEKYVYAVLEDGSVIIRKLKPMYIDGYEVLESGAFAYILKDGQAAVIGFSSSYSRPWDWMYPPDRVDENIAGYSDSLESAMAVYEPARVPKETEPAHNDHGGIVWIDEIAHDKGYTLVIPDRIDGYPVVAIYDGAFEETGFQGVTLPVGITSIGEGAFGACYDFDTIIIPDGLTTICDYAFQLGYCLTDVTIPESVTSIGDEAFLRCGIAVMVEEDMDFLGESNLILRVREGSYAEQYAKENGIRYVLTPDATAETADTLLVKQIDEFFAMTREEILEKLGSDFTVVPAGPEGVCDGYYYEDLGMAFAFYPDSDTLELIDCYPGFKIHGVGTGNLFSEILEALGDAEIVETWLELPIYTAFMVRYRLGDAEYSFIAFEEDAPVHILWIYQTPYAGPDDE